MEPDEKIMRSVAGLSESGLSGIHNWVVQHDCALISGSRSQLVNCRECALGERDVVLTLRQNKQRTNELKNALIVLDYGVTEVRGVYIEGYKSAKPVEVAEPALFVVNLKNDTSFIGNVFHLGERYCQDSVVVKEIGQEEAYLIGTNNAVFPGYGNKQFIGKAVWGKVESEFLTKIRHRPFVFQSDGKAQESKTTRAFNYTFVSPEDKNMVELLGIETMNHSWSGGVSRAAYARGTLAKLEELKKGKR